MPCLNAQFIGKYGKFGFLDSDKGHDERLAGSSALNKESINSIRLLLQMRNTMFTATLPTALTTSLNTLPATPNLSLRANPETSYVVYQRYRDVALSLIDTNSQELFYRVYENDQNSYNGIGLHEKFLYQGQSVLDISMGMLDFPWYAADGNPLNEISQEQLHDLAMVETDPLIADRLLALSNFSLTLAPAPFTRYYHYVGADGVRALTMVDEFNAVKLNIILTFTEELSLTY